MPRYEFGEGSASKFWEILRVDRAFMTTSGRIGTEGQTSVKTFGSSAEAAREYDKLVAAQVKKGYKQVQAEAVPKPAKAAARSAKAAPVVMLSMSLEDAAAAQDGAKGKALARTAAALETYLDRIAGPPEKKEHFRRLATFASTALSDVLADILDRYDPPAEKLTAYGPGDELIAYLFLLAQGGHAKTFERWKRFVAASPAQFACHLGIAAVQVTKKPTDAVLKMIGEELARKASASPGVQIAEACGLSYPPIGFWTLTMTVGSSFDEARDEVTLAVNYPADTGGWRVSMRKDIKHLSFPPLEKGRKLDGGFGPFTPPRAGALPAFFETVARKAKIKLAWETLEVQSNLKKVDGVRKLFSGTTRSTPA